ncbi:hypothetical protein [Chryseobacterium sp. c4a]|uniref:hypothetical protein n=1 Tax=Chryseobacterium sp. c4a TaxID=1573582 RepID=UPI001358AA15|nr:hypothetical protein [Chryseobacterium sp. c4a]
MIIISFNSCGNKDNYTRIEIMTPYNNQIFNGNTTIEINAKIFDDGDSIMNEELLVTEVNSNNGVPILDFKDNKFCFDYSLIKNFPAEAGKEYKIEIKAKGGHGNWTNKTIMVKCN